MPIGPRSIRLREPSQLQIVLSHSGDDRLSRVSLLRGSGSPKVKLKKEGFSFGTTQPAASMILDPLHSR